MMNRFFTLLLAASCLTAVGQEQSVFLDGEDDYINVFIPVESNDFSFSVEVKMTDLPSTGVYIVDTRLDDQRGYFMWIRQDGLTDFGWENGQDNFDVVQVSLADVDWINSWQEITIVQSGSALSLFVEGELKAELDGYLDAIASRDRMILGRRNNGPGHDFHGLMDNVFVGSGMLSVTDIQLAKCNGNSEGLGAGFWNLDNGATNSVGTNVEAYVQLENGAAFVDFDSNQTGCVDSDACNFDPDASCDDGSCVFPPVIDLGGDITSCEEWVVLEAQDGQFFQWSTGESNSIIEVSQTGFYSVEASSQIGEPNVISGHTFIGRLGQSDYYISEASISWEDARTQSESLGGHLAVITSPEENELVWQGVYGNGLNPGGTNNYQAWIGLYQDFESPDYSEPNGGWRWVTDEAVSYLNWAANRPGNLDQGYFVHMTDANGNCPEGDIVCGTWDDSGISANLQSAFYVLEVESPYGSCTSSDSIFVELDHGSCFCGPGTIWDAEMQMCIGDGSGDINLDGCVQLNDLLDVLSAYGDCGAEESPWQCGDPLEYQGYDYETVQIGEQCWFAENVRHLPEVSPPSVGSVEQAHAYVMNYSGSDEQFARTTIEYLEYGVLYNYEAIQVWELCPSGWRSPNISDLTALVSPFGGLDSAGEELKSTLIGGNNVTGFNAKAGGYRNEGSFGLEGVYGLFWMPQDEAYFDIYYGNDDVDIYYIANGGFDRSRAMSVRCINDTE